MATFRSAFVVDGVLVSCKDAKNGESCYIDVGVAVGRQAIPFYVPKDWVAVCRDQVGKEVRVSGLIVSRSVAKQGAKGAYGSVVAELQVESVMPLGDALQLAQERAAGGAAGEPAKRGMFGVKAGAV